MSLEDKLREVTSAKTPLLMSHIKHYSKQIFNGLSQLHKKGIAHRDLKPENILLKSRVKNCSDPLNLEVKIADLGATKVLDTSSRKMNTPYVVSRYYRSPELILGSHHYDLTIDVWAAGCILFELITRTPLFPGELEGL
jgi:serine/threonine protein kinase